MRWRAFIIQKCQWWNGFVNGILAFWGFFCVCVCVCVCGSAGIPGVDFGARMSPSACPDAVFDGANANNAPWNSRCGFSRFFPIAIGVRFGRLWCQIVGLSNWGLSLRFHRRSSFRSDKGAVRCAVKNQLMNCSDQATLSQLTYAEEKTKMYMLKKKKRIFVLQD